MKYKLPAEIEENYQLIGIACHQKDFKLAFLFNSKLKFSFVRTKNLTKFSKVKEQTHEFSMFYWFDGMNRIEYYLISNRFQDAYLIDSMKQLDYFLVIKTDNMQIDLNNMITELKQTPEILGVFNIDESSFKNIQNLIQDLEIHITQLNKEDKSAEEEVKKNFQKNKITRGLKR
ncbi:MAG: IPExxxVDY family protein [Bacteroidota bacterium]